MKHWTHPGTLAEAVKVPKPRRGQRTQAATFRKVTNTPLKVPTQDWSAVLTGAKLMYRTYADPRSPEAAILPANLQVPRPCLMFAARSHPYGNVRLTWEAAPGILLAYRREPLGVISGDDLEREGFDSLQEFKWYWQRRYRRLGWRPWDMVTVVELRPMRLSKPSVDEPETEDELWARQWLFHQLYGEWCPE